MMTASLECSIKTCNEKTGNKQSINVLFFKSYFVWIAFDNFLLNEYTMMMMMMMMMMLSPTGTWTHNALIASLTSVLSPQCHVATNPQTKPTDLDRWHPDRYLLLITQPKSFSCCPVSVFVRVCLSQAGIVSKRMDGSNWFLACRFNVSFHLSCTVL